ncbi:hypothetical protein HAX54_017867 [Datura stramonium]|uniref:Uncharacterized protein n=1 Tax=Datura stramonium TaxID=4076 RepID=A0ABS8UNM7_DATST|nr:hypothetical protein [Datura stramonium]
MCDESEEHTTTLTQCRDAFSSTSLVMWNKRHNQDVGASSSPPSKKAKHQTVSQPPKSNITQRRVKKQNQPQVASQPTKKLSQSKVKQNVHNKCIVRRAEPIHNETFEVFLLRKGL